ncbi:EAL domain-containing protein [Pseudoalteromonas ulvae]|uniref:Diguanylate phosphodiesterase n=1 Tax=Pseudoalteromonas ulvae TaxID=107327 RepID=A0A244CVD8_PSEDV|nr:GGDEF domain-containing protein [Pseudoalteromonas ulvae]OUL59597.1 diguanylate phosphodiesterase [Pseudoalteromonas ulvae]
MAGTTRFFLLQIFFFISSFTIGTYLFVSNLQSLASLQQLQTQKAVDYHLKNTSLNVDAETLSTQLIITFNLNRLIIKDLDGNILDSEPGRTSLPALADLIHNSTPLIRPQYVVNNDSNLKLEFTINLTNEIEYAQTQFYVFVFFIITLSFVPFISVKTIIKRAQESIGNNMSLLVDSFIEKNDKNSQLDTSIAKQSVSAIFPSIVRLNTYLKRKQQEIENSALSIKQQAFKDSVTELGNRNLFVEYYEQNIENTEVNQFGTLAMVRCSELQLINQTRGFHHGDEYIKEVAQLLLKAAGTYAGATCYRLNSSDFAVLLPNIPIKESERFGQDLQAKFTEYQRGVELSSVANTGIVSYSSTKPLGELLSQVDTALSLAQSKQVNAWHVQKESDLMDNVSANFGNQNWRTVIDDVLNNSRVQLLIQTIMPTNRSARVYSEILARFKTAEDQILPTASFLAMAEKLDQIFHVDKMIVEAALNSIKTLNLAGQFFGINITARSAHDEQFLIWLERRLLKDSNISSKLIFEISEFGLQQNVKASKRFIDMIHRVGARITVERFGVGLTSFKFFRDLKPDFIKMDASYTRGLEEDKNNQYFMRLIVDLAHRIGVTVLAEGVESQEEKHIVEQLCLDGAQGYYIEKPREI